MSSAHKVTTSPLVLVSRRRFSAEEIRQQPEFRAIFALATQNTEKTNASNTNTQNTSSNGNIIPKPNDKVLKSFRSRSYSIPSTGLQNSTDSLSKQSLKCAILDFKSDKCGKQRCEQYLCYCYGQQSYREEKQKAEFSVIMKKDEDMGISVARKPSSPKRVWYDEVEHTTSHLVCHKMIPRDLNTNSIHKETIEINAINKHSHSHSENNDTITQLQNSHKSDINEMSLESSNHEEANITNSSLGTGQDKEKQDIDRHVRPTQSAPGFTYNNTDNTAQEKEQSEPNNAHNQVLRMTNCMQFQMNNKERSFPSEEIETKSKLLLRQSSTVSYRKYDAKLEKSAVYLRSRSRTFTRATQCMEAPKNGIRQLNVHYSQTNSCHNNRIIFTDLLRNSHIQNAIVADGVYAMERRLYNRRHEKGKSTTFYDRFASSANGPKIQRPYSSPLACRTQNNSPARTVADKKKERKERIQKKDELLEMGYVPRMNTLETKGPEVIEDILMSCRYLRVKPDKQPWLYKGGEEC